MFNDLPIHCYRLVLTFPNIHIATDIYTSQCLKFNFEEVRSLRFYMQQK